jgi:hypothetical protein
VFHCTTTQTSIDIGKYTVPPKTVFIPFIGDIMNDPSHFPERWISVGGFGMETSNFGLKGCPRVSIDLKFDARSNVVLRFMPSAQWGPQFTKNVFFDEFFYKNPMDFHTFIDVFCIFLTTVHQSEHTNHTGMKFLIF